MISQLDRFTSHGQQSMEYEEKHAGPRLSGLLEV